jgi:RNA polymerase sigma-70 factor, ECF subfamily
VEIAGWDELQLVQRCKQGSEAAFAELVRRHRPRLFTLSFRLTGDRDAAEDVVQETFVAAFRTIDRFEPRPSLAAWLNAIAVHNAGKVAAKARARPRSSLDTLADDEEAGHLATIASNVDDPHLAAEAAELRRELAAAIGALPFKYRAAVVTRYVLGLEYAEAAASLEMGLNTYKSHLLRGTRMLREVLSDALDRQRGSGDDRPAAALGSPGTVRSSEPAVASQPRAREAAAAAASASATSVGTAHVSASIAFPDPRRARFRDAMPGEKAVS